MINTNPPTAGGPRWLLLIHQIPPKPQYLRVKVWRRLNRLGAVAIKNSVYALPRQQQANPDFQWVIREIVDGGGDASVCEASFIQGLSDSEVELLFNQARDADYAQLANEIRVLAKQLPRRGALVGEARRHVESEVQRLEQRFGEVSAIDFFGGAGRDGARALLDGLMQRLDERPNVALPKRPLKPKDYSGRTWVTRKGIFADRIACAWLIKRFIDPKGQVKFASKVHEPEAGEVRFAVVGAEFAHAGDRCTFEVLVERMGLTDPALQALAEIMHDIDLKDAKYGRPQAAGLESVLVGIALRTDSDAERLARGSAALDDLYEFLRRKRPSNS
jgi:hypothetical protein